MNRNGAGSKQSQTRHTEVRAALPESTSPATGEIARHVHGWDRLGWFLLLVSSWGLLVTGFALHADPRGFGTHEQLGLRPCGFAQSTGIPCPGCGLTTAFVHAVHGSVVRAFSAHPMGPFVVALVAALALIAPFGLAQGRSIVTFLAQRSVVRSLVVTAWVGIVTFGVRIAGW